MSDDKSRELHGFAEDERNRVKQRARDEIAVRDHERRRLLAHLSASMDREDPTGFAPGGVI
jgi:hypothetical protein